MVYEQAGVITSKLGLWLRNKLQRAWLLDYEQAWLVAQERAWLAWSYKPYLCNGQVGALGFVSPMFKGNKHGLLLHVGCNGQVGALGFVSPMFKGHSLAGCCTSVVQVGALSSVSLR